MSNSTALTTPSALAELQKRFCLIDLSGEVRVVNREQVNRILSGGGNGEVHFYRKADGELMMRRYLESMPVPSNPSQTIKDFWISPATLAYDQIAFTPATTPATTLNYWCGPPVQPLPGRWVTIRNYLRDVICDSDAEVYDYLVNYLAHMLQRPDEKPGIMLVLLGGQGTGKGVFFQLIRAIWPRTTLQISDVDEVLGKFNAALERNYCVLMDEALFAGDLKALDKLKSLVTEPVIRIEQKHQPSRSVASLHRFFAASNHDRFAMVERDDRRFVFLRVSSGRQRDSHYFAGLVNAISDPATLGAMVYYLLRHDIMNFEVRNRPSTVEHARQKVQSLTGFARFWYEVLVCGDLNGTGDGTDKWNGERFVPTELLMRNFKEFDKGAGRYRTVQQNQIGEDLQRLCPSASKARTMVGAGGSVAAQKRGFTLPDIDTARREFDAYVGCASDW